jgi:hypothetical protein
MRQRRDFQAGSRLQPSLSRLTPPAVSEHFPELIGCPISWSLATSCVCLELRLLPSTGITRLQRYYGPLRHPRAPGLSLTGVRLTVPDHAKGLPVLRALSLCTCCRYYPGAAAGRSLRSDAQPLSAFSGTTAGSARILSFSRFARRSLALRPVHSRRSPKCDPLSEGFSNFVTSMTAPVASGWSDWPGGAFIHWKAPPLHGARRLRKSGLFPRVPAVWG